jgi:hypothetical protein
MVEQFNVSGIGDYEESKRQTTVHGKLRSCRLTSLC